MRYGNKIEIGGKKPINGLLPCYVEHYNKLRRSNILTIRAGVGVYWGGGGG